MCVWGGGGGGVHDIVCVCVGGGEYMCGGGGDVCGGVHDVCVWGGT